ncbi:VOC family protein [Cellulomonas endometrii]|uniref:VOC family protein n=1 Tax=Cellulomonas endometrii TaxID=3036301 RepID=UPI0024ACB328|nr:VOC family protein [Cellulomonas endometrii]
MGLVMSQLCVDAQDPRALAEWWSQVLGWPVVEDDGELAVEPPDGTGLSLLFVEVPERKQVKNRLHLDLRPPDGSDQATELSRLRELGAVPVDVGQGPEVTWHVLADPEGNEFCLLRSTPSQLAALLAAEQDGATA